MPCRNHLLVTTGLAQCWICGNDFCGDCLAEFQGRSMCAACKTEAVARLESGQEAAPQGGEKAPWERRSDLGVVGGLVQTIRAVMFTPGVFFERLDKTVESMECLWVPILIQEAVAVATYVPWIVAGKDFAVARAPLPGKFDFSPAGLVALIGPLGIGVLVVAMPLLVMLGVFVTAGLTHLMLLMTSSAKLSFQQTLRGTCYAQGPQVLGLANVLSIVPIVGAVGGLVGFAGSVWGIVALIIMVKKTHRVSGWMATLAALWWVVLFFCCGMILAMTVLAGAFASLAK